METVSVSSAGHVTTIIEADTYITTYTWTIKNFPLCAKVFHGGSIQSPAIPLAYEYNNKSYSENLTLRVEFSDQVDISFYTFIKCTPFKTLQAKLYIIKKGCKILDIMNRVVSFNDLHKSNIFKSKSFTAYLDENDLIIKCKFTLQMKPNIVNIKGVAPNLEAAKTQSVKSILDEFEKLLDSAKFSDVTLIVGEKQFPVHKAILASRSPVFSAMFDHDMLENEKDVVEISDVEPEIMAEVLRFIYSSEVKDIKESTSDLLYAAVKYQLDSLRLMCEESFIEKLQSASELEEILKIADKYETCRRLRDAVLKYLSIRQKLCDDFGRFEKILSPSFFDEATKAMSV